MAGIRTRARGYALQVLYSLDINRDDTSCVLSAIHNHFDTSGGVTGAGSFADKLVFITQDHHSSIDEQLQLASDNWRVERMSTVDRNIMRLATAELLYDESVPTRVIINEAIELAKRFGTAESAAFVNGILDRVASQVRG